MYSYEFTAGLQLSVPISKPLQHCHPLLGFNGKALQTADLRSYDEEGKQGSKIKNLQKLKP